MDPYVRTLESMIIALLARRQQYIDEEWDLMPDPWSKLRVMMKTVIIQVPGFGTLRDKRRCLHRLTDAVASALLHRPHKLLVGTRDMHRMLHIHIVCYGRHKS